MHRWVVIGLVIASSGGSLGSRDDGEIVRPDPGAVIGTFQLTYYWVTAEEEVPAGTAGPVADAISAVDAAPVAAEGVALTPDATIYDEACGVIAVVSPAFARSLDQEGTGRLLDGRVINFKGACECPRSPCFAAVDAEHPWGVGVENSVLQPYRSIAVDPTVIPYGTKLWIAELEDKDVPGDPAWGAFDHDGCVIAADTGTAITGLHVDWFVGRRDNYAALDDIFGLTTVTIHAAGDRCP